MTNNIAKIRAALEIMRDYGPHCEIKADEAIAALAELERAAQAPAPVAEIREPTPEECRRIENQFILMNMRLETSPGRDVFDSVRAVMFPQKSEVGL